MKRTSISFLQRFKLKRRFHLTLGLALTFTGTHNFTIAFIVVEILIAIFNSIINLLSIILCFFLHRSKFSPFKTLEFQNPNAKKTQQPKATTIIIIIITVTKKIQLIFIFPILNFVLIFVI